VSEQRTAEVPQELRIRVELLARRVQALVDFEIPEQVKQEI
jgi:hypothetical protein